MELRDLRALPIFSTLNGDELLQVKGVTREKRFREGDVIMQEGEVGDTMYMVVEGLVEVSKSLTLRFGDDDFRKREKVLTRFRPEDHVVFGEMALIARDTRSATIMAVSDCRLIEIDREGFLGLVESLPALGVKVLLKISELLISRLRQSGRDVIRLTTALSIALSK